MKNPDGCVIYVGKAKNLKNRVRSYFNLSNQPIKTLALVEELTDFDIMLTQNEVEALLLERNLIKHHKPKYNILLRDDKEYPLVRVHFDDEWPRIEKVRRKKNDGAKYLGPFANATQLNTLLDMVGRVFPLIRCSRHEMKIAKRPCNYFHMKMCLAPCDNRISREAYLAMIHNAIKLLEGRQSELVKNLKQRMKELSANEQFELAAVYRNQITALEGIKQKQNVVPASLQNCDVIQFSVNEAGNVMFLVLFIRNGAVIGEDHFTARLGVESTEEMFTAFLLQYYEERPLPDALLLPVRIPEAKEIVAALRSEKKPKFYTGNTPEKKALLDIALKNATFRLQSSINKTDLFTEEMLAIQKLLKLAEPPRTIECIDISNLHSESIVASSVCFVEGKPNKNNYRRYNVKSVSAHPDDYTSISEIVTRRITRGIKEANLPDLLVIDGGKGQLNAALKALEGFPEVAPTFNLIALAKSRVKKPDSVEEEKTVEHSLERIFRPHRKDPIPLRPGTPAHRILTRIRDEAHRFAIEFHRKKRGDNFYESELDRIPGIGPVIKKRLFSAFENMDLLRNASLEELMQVAGVDQSLAQAIRENLNR